jgi:hypothetical protein
MSTGMIEYVIGTVSIRLQSSVMQLQERETTPSSYFCELGLKTYGKYTLKILLLDVRMHASENNTLWKGRIYLYVF